MRKKTCSAFAFLCAVVVKPGIACQAFNHKDCTNAFCSCTQQLICAIHPIFSKKVNTMMTSSIRSLRKRSIIFSAKFDGNVLLIPVTKHVVYISTEENAPLQLPPLKRPVVGLARNHLLRFRELTKSYNKHEW